MKFTDFHNTKLAEASKTRNPTRDYLRNNPVSPDQMAKPVKQMSVPDLATVSDEALDNAYHYGRSTPGNTFGWQANLKSAAYAKQMIDKGVTDIEQISDAIHKGWNITARAFVQNPDQFDDTEKLKAAGKLEAKLQQRAKLMNIEYAQLPDDEQEKDRVVARALLQAIKGQQGVAEASNTMQRYGQKIIKRAREARAAEAREKAEKEKAEQEKADKEKNKGVAEATSVIRADFAKDQGRYTNDTKPDVGGVSMTRIKVGDTVHYHGAKVEVLELDRAKDYARVEGGGRTMNVPLSKLQQYGQGVAEGYWDDAVKAIEKASKERAGKPFEKNPASHDKNGVYLGDKDLAGNPVPKHKEPGVAEAKADPLGAWIAHKNGTEARKFKTREGAKKYVASHEGFTVSSSEAFHDTYRKKKVQEVKKFRTTYGWAGGSKEPRSAHAKQVAAKRKEYEKGLGKFEPTDNMVGTAKMIKDIAMSDASPEHKKAAIDALNKKGVAEEEARIETIHGSAYTVDPDKYYVWAWDNAVVLYGEYTDANHAELSLSKIERRATKRLGPAVKGRFEVASGKMLLSQYGGEQGVAEELGEAVGGNYLYHATGSDINDLKNIISNGLITNTSNQERTGSKLRAVSFTRNWRYALTTKDDDNQGSTGIANGVIFVVDESILKQKNKMQSVDRPGDKINALRSVLNALPRVNQVADLYNFINGVGGELTPDDLVVLSKIAGANLLGSRQFVISATKTYFADKTNQQALADAQSKIKQAISYFVKTSAGKSVASAGGSTGSEYEEVILTPLNYVPFRDLGVVGYMINPGVDSAKQQEIRNLFAKVGVKEMPIPNSTTPGKNVTGATSPMIGTIRYGNRPTTDQQGVAEEYNPQDETIPKSRIARAIHMAQFAKNVAKEDAGGMGTGSVATSMGAGNGFANGGPGTITRRRK